MQRFLITTEFGNVLAEVDDTPRNALDGPLLQLRAATAEDQEALPFATPLRAFSSKMVDLIETIGTAGFNAEPKVVELLKKEKATEELRRIETWAKKNLT